MIRTLRKRGRCRYFDKRRLNPNQNTTTCPAMSEASISSMSTTKKMDIRSAISPEYFSISSEKTVEEAIGEFRRWSKGSGEDSAYLYVTDKHDQLVGVLRMRDLLTSAPSVSVKQIMKRPIVSVAETALRQEAVDTFKIHPFVALPVIDSNNRLVGVLSRKKIGLSFFPTAFYQVPQISREEVEQRKLSEIILRRLPWLSITITTGLVCAYLLGLFIGPVESIVALVFFLPVVLGFSGSVGSQSAGITIRGLEEGKLSILKLFRILIKELSIGATLGILSCLLAVIISLLWKKPLAIGFALGVSIFVGAGISALIGMVLPIVLRLMRIRSHFASGLFLLLICDIVAAALYFLISVSFLGTQVELF